MLTERLPLPLRGIFRQWGGFPEHEIENLELVPKKLIDFFDPNMLKFFEFERFPCDHVFPLVGQALSERVEWPRPG